MLYDNRDEYHNYLFMFGLAWDTLDGYVVIPVMLTRSITTLALRWLKARWLQNTRIQKYELLISDLFLLLSHEFHSIKTLDIWLRLK